MLNSKLNNIKFESKYLKYKKKYLKLKYELNGGKTNEECEKYDKIKCMDEFKNEQCFWNNKNNKCYGYISEEDRNAFKEKRKNEVVKSKAFKKKEKEKEKIKLNAVILKLHQQDKNDEEIKRLILSGVYDEELGRKYIKPQLDKYFKNFVQTQTSKFPLKLEPNNSFFSNDFLSTNISRAAEDSVQTSKSSQQDTPVFSHSPLNKMKTQIQLNTPVPQQNASLSLPDSIVPNAPVTQPNSPEEQENVSNSLHEQVPFDPSKAVMVQDDMEFKPYSLFG
jgi:hypothetical protein